MQARPRVLYLTHHCPLPTISGGRLRDAELIPRLSAQAELEVLAISRTPELDRAAMDGYQHCANWRVYGDDGPVRSYPTRTSVAASEDIRLRFVGAKPFDVVHVEGHYMLHMIPEEYWNRTVVVEHNVESRLLRQRAQASGEGVANGDIGDLEIVEEAVWRSVPVLITLSPEDRSRIIRRIPSAKVEVIGNGSDHLPPRTPRAGSNDFRRPVLGFLANYAYAPNCDALSWLVEDLFPAIKVRLPDARLLLAGSNLTQSVSARKLPDGVTARGWYDKLGDFWSAIDVFVCPLRIGGGIKVKMIEALRSGALCVSTSVGMEGLPLSADAAVARADTNEDFVHATVQLCTDRTRRHTAQRHLGRAQADLPTWDEVAASLFDCWLRAC